MDSFFNYETLSVKLESSTRTLVITFTDAKREHYFSTQMLFELESVLSWVTNKIEVHSVLINSTASEFSPGLDMEMIRQMDRSAIEKFFTKLQKINLALFHLPQTVVIDLGKGCSNIASEFAIGCDIRFCDKEAKLSFDHSRKGLIPGSGGLGFLSTVVSPAMARNWVLSTQAISHEQLLQSGFIYQTYSESNRTAVIEEMLKNIREQAPIQRIQSKLGLLEGIKARLEHACHYEKQITKAALIAEDYKSFSKQDDDFMPAKSMGQVVKLTLVKEEDSELPDNVRPL